ncbi:MAG: hypothetical protein K2H01_06895, partial [Ruminococcus sp.]|nr:hypothetical protein [Ruminococcus sp.]
MEDIKNNNSIATAFHRFISQPASSRFSALLSLAVLSILSVFNDLYVYTVFELDPKAYLTYYRCAL